MLHRRVPAAATGLPSSTPLPRRRVLAGLSAAPIALAAPGAAVAAIGPDARTVDAALIAQAAKVVRLARLQAAAAARLARREDAAQFAAGPRPVADAPAPSTFGVMPVGGDLASSLDLMRSANFSRYLLAAGSADTRHKAALAAWEADRHDEAESWSVREAQNLADELFDQLTSSAAALEDMPVTTSAGLAAKARAVLASEELGACEWAIALAESVAWDAVQMEGQTDA